MKVINRLKFLVPFFMVCSLLTYCQNEEQEKSKIVKSFFEDIFTNNISSEILYNNYAFQSPNNNKSATEKRNIFNEHVRVLKIEKEYLVEKKIDFKVENYNASSLPNLLPFSTNVRERIFIVSTNSKVESYVLVNKGKIESFHCVQKGSEGPAYFVNNF